LAHIFFDILIWHVQVILFINFNVAAIGGQLYFASVKECQGGELLWANDYIATVLRQYCNSIATVQMSPRIVTGRMRQDMTPKCLISHSSTQSQMDWAFVLLPDHLIAAILVVNVQKIGMQIAQSY